METNKKSKTLAALLVAATQINMISASFATPLDMANKVIKNNSTYVDGITYDWQKQVATSDDGSVDFGQSTSFSTHSGQFNFQDDTGSDSY